RRRRHTRFSRDWSSDVCSSDLTEHVTGIGGFRPFGAEEAEIAERAGIEGGRFEFDAMEAGVERAFGVTTRPKIEAEGDPHRDPKIGRASCRGRREMWRDDG